LSRREIAAFLLLAAVWGASFLFIRIAVPALGPFPLMAGRVLLAAGALWLFATARSTPIVLRPFAGRLLLLGLLHAAAPFALIATAELRLTASMAAVLLAAQPLFVVLLSVVWLGDRLSTARGIGLLLGMVGVAVLVGWGPGGMDTAALLSAGAVLLGALLYAAGSLYARHRLGDAPVLTLALGQQLGAAAWLVVPAVLTAPRVSMQVGALWALAALALVSTAMAYLLFFWLIGRVGPVKASTVTYAIPVFGVLWGALFLGERLTPGMVAGLGCILLSLTLVNRGRHQSRPSVANAERDSVERQPHHQTGKETTHRVVVTGA